MDRLPRFLLVTLLALTVFLPERAGAQAAPGPFVQQAFDLLMDRFVTPPSSSALLNGGWGGGLGYLKGVSGSEPSIPGPPFSGDRSGDWRAFLAAYPSLAGADDGSVDQHALDQAVVKGMVASLNSSHTVLVTDPPAGPTYGGIGIVASRDLLVTEIFPGGPAEAAGIRPGDRLVGVDGVSTEGWASTELSARVRGEVGTTVQLAVQHGDQSEPVVLMATRAEVSAPPWAVARPLAEGIGSLRLRSFPPSGAMGQFDQAISGLQPQSLRALVLDLRGNSGGDGQTFEAIVGRFVRDGPIYQVTNRQGEQRVVQAKGAFWGRDVPIAVLVDSGTGSAAELLAINLRERGIGYLFGTKTAGALGAPTTFPLDDGSRLTIATGILRSGQGVEIEHVGLEPDQVVTVDPVKMAMGQDNQLEAALDYLRTKSGG